MSLTLDLTRVSRRLAMTTVQIAALEAAIDNINTYPRRTLVVRRGIRIHHINLLVHGTMCQYRDARDGCRQLLGYQLPGDFVDLQGYPLGRLSYNVATIGEATVASIPHERLNVIVRDHPNLARMLWLSTLHDASLHREWIFRLGRLDAIGRVANLLCETHERMEAIGRAQNRAYALPLTQQDIGEACGLTSVHVNRVVRKLREDSLADVSCGSVQILDWAKLARMGKFDPNYLCLA